MFINGITVHCFPLLLRFRKRVTKSILLEILEGRCLGVWRGKWGRAGDVIACSREGEISPPSPLTRLSSLLIPWMGSCMETEALFVSHSGLTCLAICLKDSSPKNDTPVSLYLLSFQLIHVWCEFFLLSSLEHIRSRISRKILLFVLYFFWDYLNMLIANCKLPYNILWKEMVLKDKCNIIYCKIKNKKIIEGNLWRK